MCVLEKEKSIHQKLCFRRYKLFVRLVSHQSKRGSLYMVVQWKSQPEPSKPKTVEILTKGKPPKVAPQKAEKMDERPSERERKPEKSERITSKTEKNTEKRERLLEKPGKIPEKCERIPEKVEDATPEKSENAPAQEWLERMKECFERALQAAEEGRWVAWEGHMIQAKIVRHIHKCLIDRIHMDIFL